MGHVEWVWSLGNGGLEVGVVMGKGGAYRVDGKVLVEYRMGVVTGEDGV